MSPDHATPRPVRLTAADGYGLGALHYPAAGEARARLLVAGATGAGWHGWMPPLERLRVMLLWHVIGPVPVRSSGYLADEFAKVRTPIRAINATDDHWDPPASRDAFMQAYCNAPLERVTLDPKRQGRGPIGHMGYFRPQAMGLWRETLQWLREPRPSSTGTAS